MLSEIDHSWLGPALLFGVDVIKSGAADVAVEAIKQLVCRGRARCRHHSIGCLDVGRYRKTTGDEEVEVE